MDVASRVTEDLGSVLHDLRFDLTVDAPRYSTFLLSLVVFVPSDACTLLKGASTGWEISSQGYFQFCYFSEG